MIPPFRQLERNPHRSTIRAGAVNLSIGGLIAYLETDTVVKYRIRFFLFFFLSPQRFHVYIDCFQCLVISN